MNGLEELINLWNVLDEKSKKLLMAYAYGLAHKGIKDINLLDELCGT